MEEYPNSTTSNNFLTSILVDAIPYSIKEPIKDVNKVPNTARSSIEPKFCRMALCPVQKRITKTKRQIILLSFLLRSAHKDRLLLHCAPVREDIEKKININLSLSSYCTHLLFNSGSSIARSERTPYSPQLSHTIRLNFTNSQRRIENDGGKKRK